MCLWSFISMKGIQGPIGRQGQKGDIGDRVSTFIYKSRSSLIT